LQAICLGWLRTAIVQISASWVVRMTGMSHQPPAFSSLMSFLSLSFPARHHWGLPYYRYLWLQRTENSLTYSKPKPCTPVSFPISAGQSTV
jgi:hypothetical protein